MTVGSTARIASYTGNGVTTSFPVPFEFFEIAVYSGTTLVTDDLYTITQLEPGVTGTVVFLEAPASGVSIKILGNTTVSQDVDYVENDSFPAQTHERALDRLTMALQDFRRDLGQIDPAANLQYADHLVQINDEGEFVAMTTDSSGYVWVNEDGTYEVSPTAEPVPTTVASLTQAITQSVRSLMLGIGDPVLSMAPTPRAGRIRLGETAQTGLLKSDWPEMSAWLASLPVPYPFGSDSLHFTLPAAAGYALRFAATSSAIDTSGARVAGSTQSDQNKSHTHGASATSTSTSSTAITDPGHVHQQTTSTAGFTGPSTGGGTTAYAWGGAQNTAPAFTGISAATSTATTTTVTVNSTGSGGDEVRMKNVAYHLDVVASSTLSAATFGAYGFPYVWDAGATSASGLSAGYIRGNNASLASITEIYLHTTDTWGVNLSTVIGDFQVGQILKLSNVGAPANVLVVRIESAPVVASSIATIAVSTRAYGGSFTDDATIAVEPSGRSGDITDELVALAAEVDTNADSASASATAAAASATAAAASATTASTAATSATSSATTASTAATSATSSATTASTAATSATASATTASTAATAASGSATAAAASAVTAASQAAALTGTSTTSLAISVASKAFTTQASKQWGVGSKLLITSDADPTVNFMFGTVTSYSSTSLVVDATVVGGSGTHTDWTVRLAGERGPTGPSGSLDFSVLSAATLASGDKIAIGDVSDSDNTKYVTAGDIVTLTGVSAKLGASDIGTSVQAHDEDLDAIAALTTTSFGRSLLTPADAAAARTLLGVTSGAVTQPQGRLTLTANTPVMSVTASGQTTVRYTPYKGRSVPVYDGTNFVMVDTGGELTQATTDTTKSPAAVGTFGSATNVPALYDKFVWLDGSTPRCTRGPGWVSAATATVTIATPGVVTRTAHGLREGAPVVFTTTGALPTGLSANTVYYVGSNVAANTFSLSTSVANAAAGTYIATSGSQSGTHTLTNYDTARGTGAGTTELEMYLGWYVNKYDIVNGPVARKGTFVGTVASNASSTVDFILPTAAAAGGTAGVIGLSNAYHEAPFVSVSMDNTDFWDYTSGTWRQSNGSVAMRTSFVSCLPFRYSAKGQTWASGSGNGRAAVGLDATNAPAFGPSVAIVGQATSIVQTSTLDAVVSAGYHYMAHLEYGTASLRMYGDNGTTTIQNGFVVQGSY